MRSKLLLLAALAATPLAAQSAVTYKALGTRYYRSTNPHRLYVVRGGDTLGAQQRGSSVERQDWSRRGDALRTIVTLQTLGVNASRSVDTLDLAPSGRVLAIGGEAQRLRGRYDFVPRLPSDGRALRPGVTWDDSIGAAIRGPAADYRYVAVRRHRVTRELDTLGRRVVEITSEGTVRYQDAFWADSAAGTFTWVDVSGPVRQRDLFDVARGELVLHAWSMELRGRGGVPNAPDTLPAGLISSSEQRLIAPGQAALLMRPLPAGDTAITVQTGERAGTIFLHTVQRRPDGVASGFMRVDGTIGTAESVFDGGRLARFEVLWTDSAATPRRIVVERRRDSLVVHDTAARVIATPRPEWAVADYGMGEHLVPFFRTLPLDSARAIAVYRPYAGKWDLLNAVASRTAAGLLVLTQQGDDQTTRAAYVIMDDGDLLFAENAGPRGAQYVPRPGTARRAQLEAVLRKLQQR